MGGAVVYRDLFAGLFHCRLYHYHYEHARTHAQRFGCLRIHSSISPHPWSLSLSLSENNSYQQSDQSGATSIHPCTKSAIVSVSCLPLLCFSSLGIVIILVRSRNYSPSLWNNKLFSLFLSYSTITAFTPDITCPLHVCRLTTFPLPMLLLDVDSFLHFLHQ